MTGPAERGTAIGWQSTDPALLGQFERAGIRSGRARPDRREGSAAMRGGAGRSTDGRLTLEADSQMPSELANLCLGDL
jgi:hypothetical protein